MGSEHQSNIHLTRERGLFRSLLKTFNRLCLFPVFLFLSIFTAFSGIVCAGDLTLIRDSNNNITLAWDPNPEPDIAGYKVYYGTISRKYDVSIDIGKKTTCTLADLGFGPYYFAVTAYNVTGLESDFSSEVSTGSMVASSLLAAYSLDENRGSTVTDISGNMNHGLINGATWTPAGRFGAALSFDGVISYVSAPGDRMPAPNACQTVSAWVFVPSIPLSTQTVIALTAPNSHSGVQLGFRNSLITVWKYGGAFLASGPPPATNTWTYCAYTFDGTTHRLYINGVLVSSSAVTPQSAVPTILEFGRWPEGNDEFFRGLLDEVRIYGRALSQAEVQADMNSLIVPDTAPLGISNASAASVTDSSATISWNTNKASDSQVEHGWTTALVSNTALDPTLVLAHSQNLNRLQPGKLYYFRVKSKDAAGNVAVSGTLSFVTAPDTTPPSVTLTSPAGDAVLAKTVLVTASASDNVGVAGVQFLLNGMSLGAEVTAAPYSFSWDTTAVGDGTRTLSALARDAAGNRSTAANITVKVANTQVGLSNLVVAFGFDEGTGTTTADRSGQGNTASLSGASWTMNGKFRNALFFNGENNYARAGINGIPAINAPKTISWWLNVPANPTSPQDVVVLANLTQKASIQAGFKNSLAGVWRYGGAFLVSAPPPSPNTWHHYAYTYDGITHRLYIDGTLVDSSSIPVQAAVPTLFEFGRWPEGNWEFFRGLLDEVRIYSRALSSAEIQSIMNTPVGS